MFQDQEVVTLRVGFLQEGDYRTIKIDPKSQPAKLVGDFCHLLYPHSEGATSRGGEAYRLLYPHSGGVSDWA